ncbi:hypothetical protein PRIPAC_87999 [Pristionchus pacificus]|uniref:Uncharacterized protein n=1 Tax=Pristionchus pacificus TaxID=54126 RepID=A0A454XYE4_PRIPA|nr:hypothetical protein PRIPAC_87999 [Pristionchus pacificus]|eukprot:PDM81393.1 hypothetical protein PRIPAC_35269 [Pristionchus pacificus]
MGDPIQKQPQAGATHRGQAVATSCSQCGGPIIYERNQCSYVMCILCCGCFSLLCLPKRHAECAACGAKQGYTIHNTWN